MIQTPGRHYLRAITAAAIVALACPVVAAQRAAGAPATARPATAATGQAQSIVPDFPGADQTREQLDRILDRYPPQVGHVLKLDPSLINNPDYLAPYPMLGAFVREHPEIVHNPGYFLDHVNTWTDPFSDPKWRERQEMLGVLAGVAAFVAFLVVVGVLVWLIRMVVTSRRWNKLSKVQYDVHSKLLDRFSTNEDLLAYMQTPGGRRFLEAAPLRLPDEPRSMSAPLTRILWSIQAGIVLVVTGIGLLYVSENFTAEEPARFFMVIGVITLALGGGFIISAIGAYGVSRKLGLLDPVSADNA
jgi:hypothetical protein